MIFIKIILCQILALYRDVLPERFAFSFRSNRVINVPKEEIYTGTVVYVFPTKCLKKISFCNPYIPKDNVLVNLYLIFFLYMKVLLAVVQSKIELLEIVN